MRISVPAEIKNNEYRVAITPAGVKDLVSAGHDVMVQTGAGLGSRITDDAYKAQGAVIEKDAATVWASADMILKVKERTHGVAILSHETRQRRHGVFVAEGLGLDLGAGRQL